ncbi:hypothetical protein [Vreelandella olivaria]|uniref:hypothetical protein n=1 Tax=Vreelandella olivaria TaxID=390919 RepID=UPI00201F23D5|nr:hypothetical protein [Halomonas olivaria]
MTLRLPVTAFDALDVPTICHQPAEDVEHRLLFATRLLMIAVLSFRLLKRPPEADALIRQVSTIHGLDEMVIDAALEVLPGDVWEEIEEILESFGKDAIPKVYQGRDKRLCGLILVLRNRPSENEELERLFKGFESACRYDGAHYDAIMANLATQEVLREVAHQVLKQLGENPSEPVQGGTE